MTDTLADTVDPAVAEALEARYRDGAAARLAGAIRGNPVLDTVLGHRTVRAYSDRPLPPGTLETAVAAAQSAPSSCNMQAWSVIAVEDQATKDRLMAHAANQAQVGRAPLVLVFLADLARLRAVAASRGIPADGLDYVEMFLVAAVDAAMAAQNAVVALESLGLGTCYIGSIRNETDAVADLLGLPDEVIALFGLTIGYPDPARPADVKPRLGQDVVLHRERYRPVDADAVAAYDARMRGFQRGQGMEAIDWSVRTGRRIADAAALTGRHVLKAILNKRGFGLR
ncbi:NADPH-dependent oxidoreductase [Marinivivus vitaminiproducens]|uniref:NADPH-dependent oxidoreductase n=1 Tax=Marinivivus vitaminiproducens TaxID=3035935 RepID=UPI0027A42988|nr:NADPH-dependent oxidoreductase [Geminicoccaceae bacterium SCSIO 64248]